MSGDALDRGLDTFARYDSNRRRILKIRFLAVFPASKIRKIRYGKYGQIFDSHITKGRFCVFVAIKAPDGKVLNERGNAQK